MGLLNQVGWNNPGITTCGKWEMHNCFRPKYWREKITSGSYVFMKELHVKGFLQMGWQRVGWCNLAKDRIQ